MKKFGILFLLLAIFVALTVLVSCNSEKPTDEDCFIFYPLDDGTYAVECDATLVQYLTKIVIPENHKGKKVSTIVNRAFFGCDNVKTIVIPNSVTSIGSEAFYGCSNLTSLDVDESNPNYCDIEGVLFTKDKKTVIRCPAGKIESNFSIPNSVTSIGDYAFSGCSALTSIEIPNSVTSIGSSAFCGCSNLTSIAIPYGITSIEADTFAGCSKLTSIEIPNSVTSIGEYAFDGCIALESMSLPFIGNGSDKTYLGYIFGARHPRYNKDEVPESLKSVTVTGCTSISSDAFIHCSNLTNVIISNNVTSIKNDAFYNCSNLTIFCEAESKPDTWDEDWNRSNCPVVWGYEK